MAIGPWANSGHPGRRRLVAGSAGGHSTGDGPSPPRVRQASHQLFNPWSIPIRASIHLKPGEQELLGAIPNKVQVDVMGVAATWQSAAISKRAEIFAAVCRRAATMPRRACSRKANPAYGLLVTDCSSLHAQKPKNSKTCHLVSYQVIISGHTTTRRRQTARWR